MLADEGSEHLHHGGVVSGRLAGGTLQRADAADAHVKLCRAQLLRRRGTAAGHAPLAGQRNIPHGERERAGGEQPGTKCQQPTTRGVPCHLQTWSPG